MCIPVLGFAPQPTSCIQPSLSPRLIVIPAKAGIYRQHEAWIPAFAGMTIWFFLMIHQRAASRFFKKHRCERRYDKPLSPVAKNPHASSRHAPHIA
jgi:hypothetical protein